MLKQAGEGSSLSSVTLMVAVLGPTPGLKHDRALSIPIHYFLMGTQSITVPLRNKSVLFSMLYQEQDLLWNALEIIWISSRGPHNSQSRIISKYDLVLSSNTLGLF